jgi:hypothetical protein
LHWRNVFATPWFLWRWTFTIRGFCFCYSLIFVTLNVYYQGILFLLLPDFCDVERLLSGDFVFGDDLSSIILTPIILSRL